MDRPSSRGGSSLSSTGMGKAPTGSAIPQPDRPSTASRGGQSAMSAVGRPPGTAMRGNAGAPPGTAYKRLGTAQGRPGTGQQGPAGPTTRTGTTVQVENRPITQHGVLGMKFAGGGGGGRKVLDKNYFINELRQKRMEIANVTQGMRVRARARACSCALQQVCLVQQPKHLEPCFCFCCATE
jgi:intraflagellar transport protein 74